MTSRVTLADVARRAGVSQTTASFVLGGRTDMRISDEARRRVLDVADHAGYRPNLTARGLRTSVTGTIGLISDTIASTQYAGGVIRGALDAALADDRLLFIAETSSDPELEARLIAEMLDRQVDAVIYAVMYTRRVSVPARLSGVPVVALNALDDDFTGPTVLPDERGGGRVVAHALLAAGHREGIYAIGGRHRTADSPAGVYAGQERMSGLEEVLATEGVRLAGVRDCPWEPENGYHSVADLLSSGHRPHVLVCLNDRVALGAYQALQRAGMSVPDEVSVLSFDNSELAGWLRPPLSSVTLPHYELGRTAVALATRGGPDGEVHRIPMSLHTRDSVSRGAHH